MNPDLRSLLERIYLDGTTYFDADGRYLHKVPSTFSAQDLQALDAAGLPPNALSAMTHDEAVTRLRALAARIDLDKAAEAFVTSLTRADLSWQSVLPAACLGLAMPAHEFEPMSETNPTCRLCFHDARSPHDLTERALFRSIQGTGWGSYGPVEAVAALEFALAQPAWPQPSEHDAWTFHSVLELLAGLLAGSRYSVARKQLKAARLLSANTVYRCESTLEALSFISVIENAEHPGLLTAWTSAVERDQRPNIRVEVPAPLAWWSADDGINTAVVERLFGGIRKPATRPSAPVVAKPKRATAPRAAGRSLPGPVAAGDVYAVRLREDLWTAVYCHAVADAAGPERGLVEYLDVLTPAPVTPEQLEGVAYRDRRNGQRWQAWCTGLAKTTGVRRVAQGVIAPAHAQTREDTGLRTGAKDLRYTADLHFDLSG
ncbi:hypothetical protein [Lysobacter capsici]|uniref:hypothetical protein n=1 Tax=Lysobacter capsici TaxID=435897 RepID=UPI001C0079A8|nr:hypothetical protein [Lysobacter capsici]QWF15925.1 hypothetical protein KME82_19435 [Lysobacter capsici]